MFDAKVFADNVRALRISRGISQDDLAAALGVTKTFVSDIERSRRTTTIEKLIALADYFEVSLDYLTGRKETAKMNELVVIDISGKQPQPLGKLKFEQLPRPGDWIAIDDKNGEELVYDVVQIVHSSDGYGADVYVTNPRNAVDARKKLHQKHKRGEGHVGSFRHGIQS